MTQTTQVPGGDADEATRRRDITYWIDERNGKFPLPWWKVLPLVLLIGAAAIAIMTLIMIPIYERQVIDAAKDDLRAAGIDPSPFAFDASYRDLDISGILPEGVTTAQIRAAAENAEGLRDLDLDFEAAPVPEPVEPEPVEEEDEAPIEVATGATDVTAVVTDDGVVLTGEVPSERQRALLVAQATARFGAANVTDELEVLGLEPMSGAQGRTLKLSSLLNQLPEGAIGTAMLTDDSFTSEWTVGSDADGASILSIVDGADSAFDGETSADITVDAPQVEEEIVDLQGAFDELEIEIRENVTFATGSDVLNDTAIETLDKVVDLMTTYTQPVVEISGHTDNVGDDAANLALSEARAAAVRQYLIDAGIDESRIESVGLGETDPLDTADTPEARAKNRRVELQALATFVE